MKKDKKKKEDNAWLRIRENVIKGRDSIRDQDPKQNKTKLDLRSKKVVLKNPSRN